MTNMMGILSIVAFVSVFFALCSNREVGAINVTPEPASLAALQYEVLPKLDIEVLQDELGKVIRNSQNDLEEQISSNGIDFLLSIKYDRQIVKRMSVIQPLIHHLDAALKGANLPNDFKNLLENRSSSATLIWNVWYSLWEHVENQIYPIKSLYDVFDKYQSSPHTTETRSLHDFANTVFSKNEFSISKSLTKLHQFVMFKKTFNETADAATRNFHVQWHKSAFYLLADSLENDEQSICRLRQSHQLLVYNFYNLIALTELKGYAMMEFAWMLLRLYKKGNYTHESSLARETLKQRAIEKVIAAKHIMAEMDNAYYRCDPEPNGHQENTTFVQLTQLLQGHLENEVDLNSDSTCKHDCSYYSYTTAKGCYQNLFCAKQRKCKGNLVSCSYIDSDMDVCLSKDMSRRYQFIQYEDGRRYGPEGTCKGIRHKVDSWWRWLFWHCSYCLCICDEQGLHSDRYFSLRAVEARADEGYVLTGIRFVKKNRILQIQIQEGRANPRGEINGTSTRWIAPDPFRLDDEGVKDGVDFFTMTYEKRSLDLDDLTAPEGHVVIGARFRRLGDHLNFEIKVAPVDFATGKVKAETGYWVSNDNTPAALNNPRSRLPINYPDVPTKSTLMSMPDSDSNTYLEFTHTAGQQDAAQTTVPFLDAQPVTSEPPVWLSGVGLFHKGQPGYGGFVAFRIFTFDFSKYMDTEELEKVSVLSDVTTPIK